MLGQSPNKPKMLIVSSYKRQCGIAQYVEHLEVPLRDMDVWDIEIAALPVDLLKSRTRLGLKNSKKAIREIARQAAAADIVNIQFEPGLFGRTPRLINDRVGRIIRAAKKVLITYHTVPAEDDEPLPFRFTSLRRAIQIRRARSIFHALFKRVALNPQKFRHIVHTKRDARRFELLGIRKTTVTDMPLSFLSKAQKRELMSSNSARTEVETTYGIVGKKIIGCFGFLNDYKGIEVAIRALPYLPQDYHLLVVGGIHPEGIVPRTVDQPYIVKLISEVTTDFTRDFKIQHDNLRKDITERTHFCGALGDEDFNKIMVASDAIVLPYTEVGQTSSGPAAIGLDLERPVYCSRNLCFRELDRYEPEATSQFEIGNFLELADKIKRLDGDRERRKEARGRFVEKFNVENRAAKYLEIAGQAVFG
jgi:glycosyltransferase involved in cell wall biosynthesis